LMQPLWGQNTIQSLVHDTHNANSNKIEKRVGMPNCPHVINEAIGIYREGIANIADSTGFEDVLLLVSANFAYLDFLLNWEYLAKKQGLKYGIVAMDDELLTHLGPQRAVRSNVSMQSTEAFFRDPAFANISCNKIKVVLDIMRQCDVDIVFSDVDNIFYENPFKHDLGRMIKTQMYDYIYQANGASFKKRSHTCLTKGHMVREGNTGFYYLSRNATVVKNIMEMSIETCKSHSSLKGGDDQSIFWNTIHDMRKRNTVSYQHCSIENGYDVISSSNTTKKTASNEDAPFSARMCCLDPYYYPIGKESQIYQVEQREFVTYHANFVTGKEGKIRKLKKARTDMTGWNPNQFNAS